MTDGAGRRLGVLQRHVRQSYLDDKDDALRIIERNETSAVRSLPRFNPYVLADYMDNMGDLKRELYSLFQSKPELLPPVIEGMTKEQHRGLVRKQLRALLDAGYSPLHFLHKDQRRYFYIAEIGALVDLSLCIKMGVQFSLWGGSILNLGTESHHERFFDDIATYRLPGCFLMTELKHGSNVAGLQTEAVLDVVTDEWVINTPDDGAIKWWIGNAAEDGKAGTVFARLKLPKQDGSGGLQDHGVHAFVVPLRDMATSQLLPGVEIHDCGYKVGLNGVDNGAVRFTNVRIPRSNLLDRFASVDRSGQYRSGELSATKRFAVTLGELTGGRVGLVCSSVGVLKGALTIAVRYSAQRQQFGPEDGPEISILDYPSQQAKLMPMLATCYALHFAREFLVDLYCRVKQSRSPQLMADLHALSAGLKAYTTHEVAECLSVCRESCGGHGYAAVNRLGAWRSDHDIFQTFEGDNTVLLQQVSAHLLKQHRQKFAGSPLNATYAYLRQLMRDNLPQNPFVTHDTDTNHLRDPTWLSHALKYRVARLLHTVAVRLSRHTAQMGSFRAWNRCLLHLLALARAHLELVIYQRFIQAVNLCDDADSRPALKALCDLFALQRIHSEALYRDEDFMSPTKAVAIQRLIAKLCGELRGVAVPLVDAFAIPDHILRAPIGTSSFSSGADHDVYDSYLATAGFEAHDSQHP